MNHDAFNPSSEEKVNYIENWDQVPVALAPLPSKGLLYPEGHPLHGEENVEVKPMTSTEENILASEALAKRGIVADELVKSCLINKSINPETLFAGDKNSIIFTIRATGFGPEYRVNLGCDSCKSDFPHVFMLDKIKLKTIPEDSGQVESGENLFKFNLPLSKTEVYFKILIDKDFKEISKAQERRKKALAKQNIAVSKDTTLSDTLLKSIVSIGGEKDRDKISKMFRNMRAGDSRALRLRINKVSPDLDLSEEVSCSVCGELSEYVIPMTTEFFWPKLD